MRTLGKSLYLILVHYFANIFEMRLNFSKISRYFLANRIIYRIIKKLG